MLGLAAGALFICVAIAAILSLLHSWRLARDALHRLREETAATRPGAAGTGMRSAPPPKRLARL